MSLLPRGGTYLSSREALSLFWEALFPAGLCGSEGDGVLQEAGAKSLGSAEGRRGASTSRVCPRAAGSRSDNLPDCCLAKRLPSGETYRASGQAQSTPKD